MGAVGQTRAVSSPASARLSTSLLPHYSALRCKTEISAMTTCASGKFANTDYGTVARFYDFLDMLNFGNVSRRSRNYFLNSLPFVPQNPLFGGCGTGDFVKAYIELLSPPKITINDLSENMLNRTLGRIRNIPWHGEIVVLQGDITELGSHGEYDFISLNYVLNLFSPEDRIEFLSKIILLLTDNALIQVADFSRPQSIYMLPFYHLNWAVAVAFFYLFSSTKPNRLGDMDDSLTQAGLTILKKKTFIGGLYASYLLQKAEKKAEKKKSISN
jgi:ubiquinone/menaquinone biosynthesis C-methylase UbiE